MKRAWTGSLFALVLALAVVLPGSAAAIDTDRDGVPDLEDNCALLFNPGQLDSVGEGVGDACNPDHPGVLRLGPIDGLTTGWHRAPVEAAVPVGSTIQLSVALPDGAVVRWRGATEVERGDASSLAELTLSELGPVQVTAEVGSPAAGGAEAPVLHGVVLHVFDPAAEPIRIAPIEVSVEPMVLGESTPNDVRMSHYIAEESVAALRRLGQDRYRTSVERTLQLTADVSPPGLAPLVEWRVDGAGSGLGSSTAQAFAETGWHRVEAGPPGLAHSIDVQTYSVRIIAPEDFGTRMPTGQAVTFRAETEPPGFEDEVTWMSSTRFGSATPAAGRGASFTVTFDDTWGITPDGTSFQWAGVKADATAIGSGEEGELDRLRTGAVVTVQVPGSPDAVTVTLETPGPGDTVVRRDPPPYQDGDVIASELLSVELVGEDPQLGTVILHLEPDLPSYGFVEGVTTDEAGNLVSGEAYFDVYPRIELPELGLSLNTGGQPVTLRAFVTQLPPLATDFVFDAAFPIPLYQDADLIGWLLDVIHFITPCDCPDDADVGSWNGAANMQGSNNCYNYATNQQTNTFAQPGRASGMGNIPPNMLNCNEVSQRAQADGLTSNGNSTNCPIGTCLVALYVSPGYDYHWYRWNDDGTWSHKMGGTPATTKDNSGNVIGANLMGADTGSYAFCEYMCTPWNVTIRRLPAFGEPEAVTQAAYDVQILTRSGIYNPGWDLNDSDAEFILSTLEGLPQVADPSWPTVLGYAGFGIFDQTALGLPPSVRVWNGIIEVDDGTSPVYYADANGLEEFLVQEAFDRGLGGEIPAQP